MILILEKEVKLILIVPLYSQVKIITRNTTLPSKHYYHYTLNILQ